MSGDNFEKVIVVSGGSKGLGKAIVERLLNDNYFVATFSRNKTLFIESMENSFPEQFFWESIDGKNTEHLVSFSQKVFQRYNRIDGLINNMAKATDGILTLMNSDDINELFSLSLHGHVKLTQACAKYMLLKNAGSIINISSILGIRGYSGLSVYSASKGGLDAFTRALARELGEKNIRVNAIAPGYLETDMTDFLTEEQKEKIVRRTPLGRLGKVEDIIGMVRFLLSIESEFITGQTLIIDGGITC